MKRNHHPYLESVYLNGYVKEQSLRNMGPDDVVEWLEKVNKEFGRRPVSHRGRKNLTEEKVSI